MNPAFQRGIVLIHQNRYDLAEREFRRALTDEPGDASAHAYLSICLLQQDKPQDALTEAEEAVRLDPETPFHYAMAARALAARKRFREAESAARHAIALDPHDATNFGVLAAILMERDKPAEALEAADQGLAIDPEEMVCVNLRAMALVKLGRKQEASDSLGSALEVDPEDDFTHANQGWASLHQGQHKKAVEHFREALRLDPQNEWARAGLVEALKARHFLYRIVLGFFLWMQRRSGAAQIAVMLGLVFGPRLLRSIARDNPALAPWLTPIIVVVMVFVAMTWLAEPLGNLLLFFHPLGRMALKRDERWQAMAIGACLLGAVVCLVGALVHPSGWLLGAMYFGLLVFPVTSIFRVSGGARLLMAGATALIAALGIPFLLFIASEGRIALFPPEQLLSNWQTFVLASVASSWLPMLMQGQRLMR